MSNVKINGNKATEQISATSSYPIKQDKDDTAFGTFQRKVADKSVFRKVVGAATGVVGAGGVTSGVAAMVRALAGLVGAIPFVLIGIGAAAIIAGIILFVKNSRENIYIKELKNLLQSEDVNEKKQAISYLNEMIAKDKNTMEYGTAVRFLNENTEIFKLCLGSKDQELVDGITKFLTEMLKNEDTKGTAEEIIKGHIKSDNTRSMANTIKLLTELSKDKSVQTTVVKIVETCLNEKDLELRSNAIKLLTEMLKNKDIQTYAETIIKNYSGKMKGCLVSKDDQLKANTIALLTEMLKSENTNLANTAKEIIADEDIIIEGQEFANIMKGCLVSKNDQLKANTIALLIEMLRDKNIDLANIAKKIITDSADFLTTIKGCLGSGNDGLKAKVVELLNNMLVGSDDELKRKSREILKSDVLNAKGMLNIFLKNEGDVNEEAISLLSPMCKDKEIKNTLSDLIGKNLVGKLEKQGKEVKSDDVVNVLFENVVKGIFSEENKNHIIDLLKNQDGLHSIDISFDKNGQIAEVKREELKVFF